MPPRLVPGQRIGLCRSKAEGVGATNYFKMLLFVECCRRGANFVNTAMPPAHLLHNETAARQVDLYFNYGPITVDEQWYRP